MLKDYLLFLVPLIYISLYSYFEIFKNNKVDTIETPTMTPEDFFKGGIVTNIEKNKGLTFDFYNHNETLNFHYTRPGGEIYVNRGMGEGWIPHDKNEYISFVLPDNYKEMIGKVFEGVETISISNDDLYAYMKTETFKRIDRTKNQRAKADIVGRKMKVNMYDVQNGENVYFEIDVYLVFSYLYGNVPTWCIKRWIAKNGSIIFEECHLVKEI